MTTFSKTLIPLAKSRIKSTSRISVCIRVSHRNRTSYILTGVDIGCTTVKGTPIPNWFDGMVTTREPEWLQKNAEIDRFHQLILERYARCINPGTLDVSALCDYLRQDHIDTAPTSTLQHALDLFTADRTGTVTENYLRMFRSSITRLIQWYPGTLLMRDITPTLMTEYDRYLHTVRKIIQTGGTRRAGRQTLSDAQISKEKSHIKSLYNWAHSQGLVQFDVHPFAQTTIPRSESRDCSITPEQMRRIRDARIPQTDRLSRDLFMLSFYMGGINYRDITLIDWRPDTISFVRSKTRGRTKTRLTTRLPVCPEARRILNRYVNRRGRFITGLAFTNQRDEIGYIGKRLRALRDTLDLPDGFCFYSARHTFAQYALECGISDTITDYIMSHSQGRRGVISFYSAVTPKMAGLALARVRQYLEDPNQFDETIVAGLLR